MADLIKKQFTNFVGLDLKSSDITRSDDFASDMLNAQYKKDGDIEKRKGHKANAESMGGFGLFNYNRIDPITGLITAELLSVDTKLHKREVSNLNVTYSGSDATSLISIFFDIISDEYKCQIQEGVTQVLDFSLGKGFDEASPITLSSLKTAIDALTGFAAVITGSTSTPAAFLDIVRDHDLVSSSLDVEAGYWSTPNTTISEPFIGSETNKTSVDFENTTAVQLSNVLLLSNGYDEVQKYDGQTVYRAGIPTPSNAPTTALTSGSITGIYRHAYRYVQKDAVGNFIEGFISPDSSPDLSASTQSIDVTVDNILAGSGFNTNCAIVAGAQGPVNIITVDDGSGGSHTLKVGDTAYFFDSVSGAYVERNVDAVGASTITVAGAAVTVADNAVISNNLRIQIYRNQNGGLFKFLVEEIPNNSFTSTQTLNDNKTDVSLGIQFIVPLTDRGLPPKGRYLASFNSQLVIAGQIESPDQIFWSDVLSPEYFPTGNNLRAEVDGNEKITGIGQTNQSFAIFKERSIDIISGEIESNNIRREVLTKDLGCAAHATIKEVEDRLFFLSDRGVFSLVSGQLPTEESFRIEPAFKQEGVIDSLRYKTKRAIAVNHREDQKYILYLPIESVTAGPDIESTSNSTLFVFDFFRQSWLKWNNYNLAGGSVIHQRKLYFTERRLSTFTGTVDHILYVQMASNDAYDYMDHDKPVNFSYSSNWIHLGEPSIFKTIIRLKVHSIPETQNNPYSMIVKGEKDFIKGFVVFNIPLDFNSAAQGYGLSSYGTTAYGDIAKQSAKHKINKKVQALRFIFENETHQENVSITGFEIVYSARFKAEIKD